ncbi:PSMG4 protein, partial [Nothocercus nigrocapillus]|nr:PSMG4 protein [Nothocercus nigrocapillus]
RAAAAMEAAGGIGVHDFSGQLGEQLVHFHAMRLRDSLFLWVGAAPALASLAVAMCSPRDSVPVSASLLGDPSDPAGVSLARRLGRCCAAGPGDPRVRGSLAGRGAPRAGVALAGLTCGLPSKTKKQIFVSYNLQNTDSNFSLLIENRIKEEMMAFPEKF